jgi:putative nucleotidyltransferase with HDIG domain
MEGRLLLARQLIESRAQLAPAVLERLTPGTSREISPLIVRALVSAFGQAVETASPEPVIAWARMADGAYSVAAVHELVAVTAEVAAEAAEPLDLDFSSMLVFLEIVKGNVREAFPAAEDAQPEESHRAAGSVIDGVLAMLQARDEATCAHSHATGAWCRRLAETMGLSAEMTDVVVKAGILHDIGKIATPDAILFKPGPLDDAEWTVMRQHAEFGARILSELPALARYAPIVRAHHERWDGRGYPLGLKGEEIPFEARIVAVADAFHAMISHRPYRPALAQREALEILRDGRGTQWDAKVVDAMIAMLQAPRTVARREAASR